MNFGFVGPMEGLGAVDLSGYFEPPREAYAAATVCVVVFVVFVASAWWRERAAEQRDGEPDEPPQSF